jgi:DNA-binding transcriptional MerR regulator
MEGNAPVYSISTVAKMLGVPVATLRTWEDRYGLVVPDRTPSGHRLYSRQQIGALEFVKLQMDQGLSAADAHRLLKERGSATTPKGRTPETVPSHVVLLAENDPYASEFEEHFLKSAGYGVEVALEFEAAEAAVDQIHPSLVVIEVLISGGRGLELCRMVKRREHPPAVLTVSTLDAPERALGAGADAFLKKPLEKPRFLRVVQSLLGDLKDQPAAI